MSQLGRRQVLLSAGIALLAPAVLAQKAGRKYRVGMLFAVHPDASKRLRAAFTARMEELGWREGINIEYWWHYAETHPAPLEQLVAELVARGPDLIFVSYGPMAATVKKHTRDLPIVFAISSDPVGEGLVASLAKPGGNVTGVSTRSEELIGKRLQLLKEALPFVSRIGLIRRTGLQPSTQSATKALHEGLKHAAGKLGLHLVETEFEPLRAAALESAFAQLKAARVDAIASLLPWNWPERGNFARYALQARLPTICDATEFVEAGGFMSLSVSYVERYRRSVEYVDRILRGAKPADLPVEEPTVFEFMVNLRTARELGITIPPSILLRADRVIE